MTSALVYVAAFGSAAAVLCGAIWCFGRQPKAGAARAAREPNLLVLSRTRVGIGRTLVLVEVEGRRLLLGSTRGQWCALADLGRADAASPDPFDQINAELARAALSARSRGWNRA